MIRHFVALATECFLFLRRDKIFIPIVLVGLGISLLAVQVSDFSFDDFTKIIYDVGILGFRVTGAMVAVFWGAKLVQDPLLDRSIDLRIAAPIPRFVWLLARYVGFACTLCCIAILFVVFWQAMLLTAKFGWMKQTDLIPFLFLLIEWLVLGAIAMFFATSARLPTALFATLALWVAGLIAPLVTSGTDPNVPVYSKIITGVVGKVWNFQRFNFVEFITLNLKPDYESMRYSGWYGLALISFFMIAGCWSWSERDLQ